MTRPIVIVSNRGPVSFRIEDGELVGRRGAGGLVSGLGPLVSGTDATWMAAALSEGDRLAASKGAVDVDGFRVRTLAIDEETFRMSYDVVCNATLWFVHHGLFDTSRRPRFDRRWQQAWDAYRSVNLAFAEAVAEEAPEGAAVLVQDYHFTLMAPPLSERRPDLRLVHFSHTPFAGPDLMRVMPDAARAEMLEGLAAHHARGFHTARWAAGFEQSCRELVGIEAGSFVSPLATDPDDIASAAASETCQRELDDLEATLDGRAFLVRVDRIELSKNILRGFWAFDDLLERYPQWRERVVFGAFCYPSREGLAEYLAYRQEVETLVQRINERWATPTWTPIMFEPVDDFLRSVAALRRYDVLLVNPVRDGLNLVAKEGSLVNERHGLVALSTEAGVWDELAGAARAVNPFDVSGTADVLHAALGASPREREEEAAELLRRARSRTPADWLADQLRAAE